MGDAYTWYLWCFDFRRLGDIPSEEISGRASLPNLYEKKYDPEDLVARSSRIGLPTL